MSAPEPVNLKDVGRAAMRAELAQVGFDLFIRHGFDAVTLGDIASAAGVSRSTVLRYFGTKEDVALGTIDARGSLVAAALVARPAEEDNWTAIRRALDVAVEPYLADPVHSLEFARLTQSASALRARSLEKQHSWQGFLAEALAERPGARKENTLSNWVVAGVALVCMSSAGKYWTESDGEKDLVELLDAAFQALSGAIVTSVPASKSTKPRRGRPPRR